MRFWIRRLSSGSVTADQSSDLGVLVLGLEDDPGFFLLLPLD